MGPQKTSAPMYLQRSFEPLGLTVFSQPRVGGDVDEAPVVVTIESDQGVSSLFIALQRGAVDDQRVFVPIIVVIEESRSIAVGFEDVVFGGAPVDIHQRDPGFFRD